ncbi:unnamed protein product, partial [Prorocentrum cordatum]
QGFVHTLLYKTASPSVVQAVEETGASLPTAVQVDRCIWNHQHDGPCKTGGCQAIVMLHKDTTCGPSARSGTCPRAPPAGSPSGSGASRASRAAAPRTTRRETAGGH